ncbi:probable cytochrome P450 313a4 isoform X1 [Stomoxys calcitrans]|uniref:probable cytochrome P450 313a4 isoform X1 n=2 Tax=Stomoxys calcitrans TaxID=35570 RepID=UPI0027E238A9|nr:probable cytochrome P450 313a4 isoform X1 [Stomoxys calcitrans]
MSVAFWLIFAFLIAFSIQWLWSRRRFYAMIFKIPGPVGLPILGAALKLMPKEAILKTIHEHSERHGSLMFSWLGTYPFLVVTEPDIVRDILTSPDCVNKSLVYEAINNCTGKGLFGLEDPQWSIHRKHLNATFSQKVLLSFLPIFNEEANELLRTFDDKYECAEIITVLQSFALKTAIRTTMGYNCGGRSIDGDSNHKLLTNYQCLVENMTEMAFSPWLAKDFLRKLLRIYEPYQKAKADIQKFLRELINKKYVSDESDFQPHGPKVFVDHAIQLMRKNIFSRQNVEDEVNVIVIGAFETTANTIGFALILLAMFPEYQQKVFEELLAIFPKRGDFEVTYENVRDMIYMDMVLNESMRIFTPVPLVARQNSKDLKLSNGITLPAGIQICINIFTMHRRKDIWGSRANIFNPDNFLPSNMELKHPYAFIPFTKGLRNCIGWRYGLILAKVVLAKMLRNYIFTTDFKYKDLEFIEAVVLKLEQVPVLKIRKREY